MSDSASRVSAAERQLVDLRAYLLSLIDRSDSGSLVMEDFKAARNIGFSTAMVLNAINRFVSEKYFVTSTRVRKVSTGLLASASHDVEYTVWHLGERGFDELLRQRGAKLEQGVDLRSAPIPTKPESFTSPPPDARQEANNSVIKLIEAVRSDNELALESYQKEAVVAELEGLSRLIELPEIRVNAVRTYVSGILTWLSKELPSAFAKAIAADTIRALLHLIGL